MQEISLIPFERLHKEELSTIQDQLWTIKSIVSPEYALKIERLIEAREQEVQVPVAQPPSGPRSSRGRSRV